MCMDRIRFPTGREFLFEITGGSTLFSLKPMVFQSTVLQMSQVAVRYSYSMIGDDFSTSCTDQSAVLNVDFTT